MGAKRAPRFDASARTISTARRLRADPTHVERVLWRALKSEQLGVRFRRQHPIPPYVADFACVTARLVVELDGGQHGDERDARRDAVMREAGWCVLRVWNSEVVENLEGVLLIIGQAVDERVR